MRLPPYPGQGTPLPPSMRIDGEWIIKNRLYPSRQPDIRAPDGGHFAQEANAPNGAPCIGFEIQQIAKKLEITPEELVEFNKRGELTVGVLRAAGVTADGGIRIRTFFKTPRGTTSVAMTIERPAGNA